MEVFEDVMTYLPFIATLPAVGIIFKDAFDQDEVLSRNMGSNTPSGRKPVRESEAPKNDGGFQKWLDSNPGGRTKDTAYAPSKTDYERTKGLF